MDWKWCLGCLAFALVVAAEGLAAESDSDLFWASTNSLDGSDARKLSSYRSNFFGYVDDAERKFRLDLSIKYPLLSLFADGSDSVGWLDVFFAYSGSYDFDFQRASAPLVSRLQEPGFFVRYKDPAVDSASWYSAGYFHQSNGQVLNRTNYFQSVDPHREDLISRGWDFAELNGFQRWARLGQGRIFGGLDLRVFLPFQMFGLYASEEDIFWDPAGQGVHRNQYDGIRPSLTYLNAWFELTDEFRMGWMLPAHFSNQLSLRFRQVPLGLIWFNGYGEYLSRYEAPGNALCVGLYLH